MLAVDIRVCFEAILNLCNSQVIVRNSLLEHNDDDYQEPEVYSDVLHRLRSVCLGRGFLMFSLVRPLRSMIFYRRYSEESWGLLHAA